MVALRSQGHEKIRKLWYIYKMEYYSAIKNNAVESVLMRWMKLEPIIQSEVSQKEKHKLFEMTEIDLGWGSNTDLEKAMAPHYSTFAWKTHGRRSLVGCRP